LLETCPIENGLINNQQLAIFQFDIDIYFLFNPWQKDDVCALLSPEEIAEYVMNEHGQIYLGSLNIPRPIPWYFGQFESAVLLTALTLLNRTQLSAEHLIDLPLILRIISSKICSDPGTMNGIFRSSCDIQPLPCQKNGYTSSPAILRQYLLLNGQSVQGDSGSNWQHAAVFCSLCRSLGIPCRIVTVYNAITKQQPIVKVNSNLTWLVI
jgi:transglutaminase 1